MLMEYSLGDQATFSTQVFLIFAIRKTGPSHIDEVTPLWRSSALGSRGVRENCVGHIGHGRCRALRGVTSIPGCAIHRSLCGASGELRNPRIPSVVYGESGDVVYVLAKLNLIVLCTVYLTVVTK